MAIPDKDDEVRGAYSIPTFCRTFNVGTTFTYDLIKTRKLRAVKCGGKTLILRRDAEAWVNSLPELRTSNKEVSK